MSRWRGQDEESYRSDWSGVLHCGVLIKWYNAFVDVSYRRYAHLSY